MPNIAKHFLVWKASSVLPGHTLSLVVNRQGCKEIQPRRLQVIEDNIRISFAIQGLRVVSICGDGATENIRYFKRQATKMLSTCLSQETQNLFREANMEDMLKFKCVGVDRFTKDFIFFLEDMPHLIKRLVNAMDRSSNNNESRNLRYGAGQEAVLDLLRIKEVWWACGGQSNQIGSKLTQLHFQKDNFSRMRVSYSVQVLSNSVVQMLKFACSDEEILTTKLKRSAEFYEPLIQLATHVNELVDIVNG